MYRTLLICLLACGLGTAALAGELNRQVDFDIPAQPLSQALADFSRQADANVVATTQITRGKMSGAVKGATTLEQALKKLLAGTDLRYRVREDGGIVVDAPAAATSSAGPDRQARIRLSRVEQAAASGSEAQPTDELKSGAESAGISAQSSGIPEILVKGTRSGNTDIRRTEDDVQPYVVFDAEQIGRSMAPDLGTFLKTRLPMNTARLSENQDVLATSPNTRSTIDLRGLGADQTLILVNGRRMPGAGRLTDIGQPDINGIPISAVERIEILPSTAGGIYGGGATGGVVNIILKRNYNDLELIARYDGTFDGGAAERRLDATAGFSLEGGRTNVMVIASYRDGNPLYIGDRNFLARAWALQDRNNHAAFRALGNPVHGYTTNIRSADGSDLVLEAGMVSLGSPIAHVPVGYAGPGSDNGAAFLGTADEYNLIPANDVLGNQYTLLNTPNVRSLQLSVRREFTDRIEAFVDASRYDNRSVRKGGLFMGGAVNVTLPPGPDNPFVQPVQLSVPVVGYEANRQRQPSGSLSEQLNGGIIVRLPREWTVQGEYSLSRSEVTERTPELLTADGSAALIDGRLNPLRDVNAYPLDLSAYYPSETSGTSAVYPAERTNATLRLSGPLLALPGGPLRLAALMERREESPENRVVVLELSGSAPRYDYYPGAGARTDSGYIELNAPLFSAANARPALLGLDLRASYRYDSTTTYATAGSEVVWPVPSPDGPFPQVSYLANEVTGNQYTLGFRYTPAQSVALRLSYGEGILPPSPQQLTEFEVSSFVIPFFLRGIVDPKRGGLPVSITSIQRYTLTGNLQLRPERSASWSGGVIVTPASLPGFRLSVDYTRIEKTDEIGRLNRQVLLDLEDRFPGAIVRNELTAADAALGYTGGTIRVFNDGNVNIAGSLMEAFDIQADYRWQTRFGSFDANVIATVQPHLSQQALPGVEAVEIVGYSDGPLKWRANAGLRFSRGAWELGWNLQYYDAYRVYTSTASPISRGSLVLGQGSPLIPTQTYHDVYGRYRFQNASAFAGGLLANTELQITVQNVLDTSPPILASASQYLVAGYTTEGDPRLRRYSISFTKRFGL